MSLVEKIIKVQSTLKAPKNQRNNFGNYNYRSCEDILEAVKPLLAENGLILTISDEMVMLGNRFYVKAEATITDGENKITNSAYAREEETKKGMDASQITGAASSYARKYALNGLFCIDDTKDADATNDHGNSERVTPMSGQKKTVTKTPETNDQLVKDKIEECKKSIASHVGKYTDGDAEHAKISRFANKIYSLGYEKEGNEIIRLLEEKTEPDYIPFDKDVAPC